MFEDSLQLCSVEKWSELEEALNTDLPRSIGGVIFIQMQRYILECGIDTGYRVYCPYGNAKYGLVAINVSKGNELTVHFPSDDTSKLEEALKTTRIIDWENEIQVAFASKHIINCFERVIENKNVEKHLVTGETYVLDKSSPLFNVELPEGVTFDLLSLEHVDLLASTWPHRSDGCNAYFELIIKSKLGYGLYKQKQLVSWVLVRETGPLLHLYTLQQERRKGYGEIVLKLISNVLLKNNKYVIAYSTKDNVNAVKLYHKLNFQQLADIDFCTVARKS